MQLLALIVFASLVTALSMELRSSVLSDPPQLQEPVSPVSSGQSADGTMGIVQEPEFPAVSALTETLDRPLIPVLADALKAGGISLGAQDCHADAAGAHTGDQSAEMLADAGCAHVIVGHSERRTDHAETDKMVKAKADAALAAGLKVIVCIGETLQERKAGQTLNVNRKQLRGSLPVPQLEGVRAGVPVAQEHTTTQAVIPRRQVERPLEAGDVIRGGGAAHRLQVPDGISLLRRQSLLEASANGRRRPYFREESRRGLATQLHEKPVIDR